MLGHNTIYYDSIGKLELLIYIIWLMYLYIFVLIAGLQNYVFATVNLIIIQYYLVMFNLQDTLFSFINYVVKIALYGFEILLKIFLTVIVVEEIFD